MVSEIKQAIANRLSVLFPDAAVYDEDVPQGFKTPSFMMFLIEGAYRKEIDNRYSASASFDLAYFPKSEYDAKNECHAVLQNIMRSFDDIAGYKAVNKSAEITDNVLHVKFTVRYRELKETEYYKINNITIEQKG